MDLYSMICSLLVCVSDALFGSFGEMLGFNGHFLLICAININRIFGRRGLGPL